MNYFKTSNGSRISKKRIDELTSAAKKLKFIRQVEEYGFNFCEKCFRNRSNTILDAAHIRSVNDVQNSGECELAYDINNIMILCRDCHKDHDKLTLFKK